MQQATAREELLAGNRRFLAAGMHSHMLHAERVVHTGVFGQSPSVGILSCSDSRVPPEIIFDQGIGEVFGVRDAGNFEDVGATATFEYGVAALGVHTITVLGHTKCGAIDATVSGQQLPGNMPAITAAIAPGLVEFMKSTAASGAKPDLTAASEANARWQAQQLMARSALLRAARASGSLTLLAAIYDVDTGVVRFRD
ncbi:MAG: carbonic anhydrase [Phycisphaerales bacterium]|nr:carbonic anhydrase [Phycisphaerales bacterium]